MRILSFLIILLFSGFTFPQRAETRACSEVDKPKVIEYFSNLQNQNNYIFECLRNRNRADSNIKPFRKISHVSSPVINLVKPFYPEIARNNGIFGLVKVEAVFDESGKVFYAKAIQGTMIFYENAEKAACASKFFPVRYCEKAVSQKAIIRYNFIF